MKFSAFSIVSAISGCLILFSPPAFAVKKATQNTFTPLVRASKDRLPENELRQRCLICSLAPTEDRFKYELGILLGRENQYQLAEQHLRKAIELCPDAVDYWTQLGFVYQHIGKYKEAGDAFKVASQKFKGYEGDHLRINGTLIAF